MAELDIEIKGIESINEASNALANGANNVKSLKAQLRDLQSELSNLDPNSDKFLKLSQQAGELKDKMNDAAEATRASAGPAFEQLGNNASLLTQRIGNLDFEGAAQSVKALAVNVKGVRFNDLANGVKTFGSTIGALGKALLTNPIFLLAAVIAAIVMNFESLKGVIPGLNEALTGVSDEMTSNLETSKKLTEEAQKQLDTTSASENILKLQGKSEREILELKIKQTQSVIDGLQAQIESQKTINKAQVDAAKRNKEILSGIIQFVTYPLQLILKTVDEVGKLVGKDFNLQNQLNDWASSLVFDPDQVAADGEKALQEQQDKLLQLQNAQAGYQLSIQKMDKDAADKRRDAREKEQAELLKSQQEVSDLIAQLEAEQLAAEQEAERVRREALVKENEQRIAQEENYYKLSEELRLASMSKEDAEREARISALVTEYEEKYLLAEGNAELERQLAEQQAKDIDAINKDYADKEVERQKTLNNSKLELASSVFGALQQLNDTFQNGSERSARRAFAVSKALALAEAIMNTYKGVSAVLADPTLIGPARWIGAGVALTTGLANVAKIAKSKFEPSGGGSAPSGGGGGIPSNVGSGSGGGTTSPNFTALNTSFLNNRPGQSPTVQAYVVSGNVSSELEASTKIKDKSRL
jgi:hypothetical protein